MRGNSQVRFLGEGVAAMPLPYPTNFVTHKKPKALTGFDQKVRGWLIQFPPLDYRDTKATGEETEPNPSLLIAWDVVNPTLCQ
jgi:hypothetical protein